VKRAVSNFFRPQNTTSSPRPSPKTSSTPTPKTVAPKEGSVVGAHEKPLDEKNIGNKLMRAMGWSGGGLGAKSEGIVDPVAAVYRKKKTGLGF
jgi:hypothetical protein